MPDRGGPETGFDGPWWHYPVLHVDGLLVLLICAIGQVVLRRRDWFEQPGIRGYVLMLAAGLAISVDVEWATVYVAEWWAYQAQMPLVPGLDVGIAPLMQMLVLPPVIFYLVAMWWHRTLEKGKG